MPKLKCGSLIASCQAIKGEPLHGLGIMKYMAYACVCGGAKGIRACGIRDIQQIGSKVNVPIIGLIKEVYKDSDIYITPTLKEVKKLLKLKAVAVIALDATNRRRPNDEKLADLVKYIRDKSPQTEIMADISTLEEAINAEELGFDYIGTTLRGYTEYTREKTIPDIDFLNQLQKTLTIPVIAEGGIWETEQLSAVLRTKIYAVVVGTAITRPKDITKRFIDTLNRVKSEELNEQTGH